MTAAGPACRACLRRTWLVAALGAYLERACPRPERLLATLALPDEALLELGDPGLRANLAAAYARFDAHREHARCRARALEPICRHHRAYPVALGELEAPPAVLQVAGDIRRWRSALAEPAVALVGARQASDYGLQVAEALGRGLAAAGLTVVSGLALGIDSAAHEGALASGGRTMAVLAGGADVPYPARRRGLYRRVAACGGVVSEAPPGFRAFRWSFLARNRIVAGLARAVIVVEARESSGSLLTARLARELGRDVGAVPGRVTASLSAGPLSLLAGGARVIRGAQDALDLVCGVGVRRASAARLEDLKGPLRELLAAVSDGRDTLAALVAAGHEPAAVAAGLGELELRGYLRRSPRGGYTRVVAVGGPGEEPPPA